MSEKLKPAKCGCGGSPIIAMYKGDGYVSYYIYCSECSIGTDYYETEDEAINVWNIATRADHFRDVKKKMAKAIMFDPDKSGSRSYWSTDGKCEKCGAYLEHMYTYCYNCGAKLEWR